MRAVFGTFVFAAGPMSAMRPASMRTTWSGSGARPVASMTVTCVIASSEVGSAEKKDGTTRKAASSGKNDFLDLKGMLTFRAIRQF